MAKVDHGQCIEPRTGIAGKRQIDESEIGVADRVDGVGERVDRVQYTNLMASTAAHGGCEQFGQRQGVINDEKSSHSSHVLRRVGLRVSSPARSSASS